MTGSVSLHVDKYIISLEREPDLSSLCSWRIAKSVGEIELEWRSIHV